ncbi:dynein regulatory complex protein 9 [Phlebotomus argentipes]|uniref:dynein regulatory complex protein 9 n=1 Tax=Phlebotomus argentipes TaxID=94469 RepID=UPI002892E69F|nr:dynein regulatory complex protein 9 [Phlebotomus argentipes]
METLLKTGIGVLLENSVDSLLIINRGRKTLKKVVQKRPIQERFRERIQSGVKSSPGKVHSALEAVGKGMIFMKLEEDIDFFRYALEETVMQGFPQLRGVIDMIHKEGREEYEIIEEYNKNKKLSLYLEKKLRKDSEDCRKRLKDCDEKLIDLQNQQKDCELENAMRCRLVLKWEATRHEQAQSLYDKEHNTLLLSIREFERKSNQEERIMSEMDVFSHHQIDKLESMTQFWIERYNRELVELDEKLRLARIQIESLQMCIRDMQDSYNGHQEEIDEYLEQKRLEDEARRLEQKKWDSAVRIQAWWRGTMVRNCLGPYRKKKKGKKGKAAKKKK